MKRPSLLLLGASLSLSLLLTACSTQTSDPNDQSRISQVPCAFDDICDLNDRYLSAILHMKEAGLFLQEDRLFHPDEPMTRAEFYELAFRSYEGEVIYNPEQKFLDIEGSEPYAAFASKAKELGVFFGDRDGKFSADEQITQAEAISLLAAIHQIPLPELSKSVKDQNGYEQTLPYQVSIDDEFAAEAKLVYDFNLLDRYSIDVYQPISRKDVARLYVSMEEAKPDIKGDLKLIGKWYDSDSKVGAEMPLYFFFNKPLDLDAFRDAVEVRVNGADISQYEVTPHTWTYDPMLMGLKDYQYLPQEYKITSRLFTADSNVEITFKEGLGDIYGTSLPATESYAYHIVSETPYLAVDGNSYFLSSAEKKVSIGGKYLSGVTAYLCQVSPENYSANFQQTTHKSEDGQLVQREYVSISTFADPKETLSEYCDVVNTAEIANEQLQNGDLIEVNLEDLFSTEIGEGIYYLYLDAPEIRHFGIRPDEANNHKFIYVSDVAITIKHSDDHMLVWATDARSGDPVSGASVQILNGDWDPSTNYEQRLANVITEGRTNKDGVFETILEDKINTWVPVIAVVNGNNHFGIASSQWNDGIEAYQYNLPYYYGDYGKSMNNNRVHLYTDRKIYRPLHEVHYKGVLRSTQSGELQLPELREVEVLIKDAEYNDLYSQVVQVNRHGSFSGSYILPETATLGYYTLEVHALNPDENHEWDIPSTSFEVEEYRRPEFFVSLSNLAKDYMSGDKLDVTVDAEYYFGLPVTEGYVTWELTRESLYFRPLEDSWFSFYDGSYCGYWCDSSSGTMSYTSGDLEKARRFTIPLDLSDVATGGLYTLSVRVSDQNGREVSKRESFRVHKAETYVGVQADGYMTPKGDELSFSIVTVAKDGTTLGNQNVDLTLYQRAWTKVTKEDVSGNKITTNEYVDTEISTRSLTTSNDGTGTVTFDPQDAGSYYVRAAVTDSAGRKNSSREYTYVYSGDDGYVSWAQDDAFKVSVLLDKPEYNVGDEMSLMVQSPFETSKALVTIERDRILDYYVIDLPTNSTPFSLPVKASYIPNAFVSVLVLDASGTPGFRLGYSELRVDTKTKELNIHVETDKQTYNPGDTARVTVKTTNVEDVPVSAEVSLAVVDESVIALAGGVDRAILEAFYAESSLEVFTAQSLTHYVEKAILRTLGGSGKGGDSGLPLVRGNLKDTAYWNANVETDQNGKAEITFVVPDNLTRWELLAIGHTDDSMFGSMAHEIATRLDLVVQPVLPRFVRQGDDVEFTYTIFNLMDEADDVTVSVSSNELELEEKREPIRVGAKESTTVTWVAKVPTDVSEITLIVEADGQKADDAFMTTLPVKEAHITDKVVRKDMITGSEKIALAAPVDDLDTSMGNLTLNVSLGLLGSLKPDLRGLLMYPYGCAEQTTSTLLPNLYLKHFMERSDLEIAGVTIERINSNVEKALQKLYTYQSDNGGWSLWGGNEYVDDYLTAYVLSAMHEALEDGYVVEDSVMVQGRAYLEAALASGVRESLDDQVFVLHVAAMLGASDISSYASKFYEQRENLSWNAIADLIEVYDYLGDSSRVEALIAHVKDKMVKEDDMWFVESTKKTWYGFNYNTYQANAKLLHAIVSFDSNHELVAHMIPYVVTQRQDGYYFSTHDTALAVKALSAYLDNHLGASTPSQVKLSINGEWQTIDFDKGELSDAVLVSVPMNKLGGFAEVSVENNNDSVLYLTSTLSYYDPKSEFVQTGNMLLTREIFDEYGNMITEPLKLGDRVKVRLSFESFDDELTRIAIEDHLPAGLEALNGQLNTVDASRGTISGWVNQVQMFDDRVFLYKRSGEDVVYEYEAQAIAPGTFTWPEPYTYEMYDPATYMRGYADRITIER